MYGSPYQQIPQYQNYQNQQNPYAERLNAMERMTQMQHDNVNWIRVGGIEEVKNIIVQPNSTAWAMDNNEPIFYVKTADSMGVCNIEAYKYERINVNEKRNESSQQISREEFEMMCAKIKEMEEKLNESINKQNIAPRNAVYAWKSTADDQPIQTVSAVDAGQRSAEVNQ